VVVPQKEVTEGHPAACLVAILLLSAARVIRLVAADLDLVVVALAPPAAVAAMAVVAAVPTAGALVPAVAADPMPRPLHADFQIPLLRRVPMGRSAPLDRHAHPYQPLAATDR